MEIIVPVGATLVRTGSSPTYIAPVWASGAYYASNTVVRREVSGAWRDYRAKSSHTASSWNAPPRTWTWTDLGPSGTSGGFTYTTNVRLSNSPTWAATSIAEGATVYDDADQHDYRALIAMSAGENTARPSVAVLSGDETVRSRWLDLGAANAWAPFDHRINAYLEGYDAAGSVLDTVNFLVDVDTDTDIDRVAFAGLVNVDQVSVLVRVDGEVVQAVYGMTVPHGATLGAGNRSMVLRIDPIKASADVALDVYLTRRGINRIPNPEMTGGGATTAPDGYGYHAGSAPWTVGVASGAEKYAGSGTMKLAHPASPAADLEPVAYVFVEGLDLGVSRYRASGYWAGRGAKPVISIQWRVSGTWSPITELGRMSADKSGGTLISGYERYEFELTALPGADAVAFHYSATPHGTTPESGPAAFFTLGYFGYSERCPVAAPRLGVMAVGRALELAYTEWNVETSIIPFSQKERNATFGTTTFVRRGSARQVRAACFIDTAKGASGDVVQQVLSDVDGMPVYWDFNNSGSDYDRLRVFGFYSNMRMAIPAFTFESLSLDVEGLVE